MKLRVTADGLTASIAAERPEAVQALQQAGAELRRNLEQRGLTVLAIDVALAGPSGGHASGDSSTWADRSADGRTSDPTGGTDSPADAMEAADATTPRGVPAGALVDVLA